MASKASNISSASSKPAAGTKGGPTSSNARTAPKILEPEFNALGDSLRKSAVIAGQIFKFHSDAKRYGVNQYVPRPPRSLTNSLSAEVGRYDQICDILDANLARSIAILQRDLNREEARVRAEEEKTKALAKAAEEIAAVGASAQAKVVEFKTPQLPIPASGALAGPLHAPSRRQSKVSLSTLHRPQFPSLKLDLSSVSLRMNADDAGITMTGLPSPVTLAPKSARPMAGNEIHPDLLAALTSASEQGQDVDLDLVSSNMTGGVDDLDSTMSDLFGDVPGDSQGESVDVDSLFNATNVTGGIAVNAGHGAENMGDILDALSVQHSQGDTDDLLFGPLNDPGNTQAVAGPSNTAPSPSSLLASFVASGGTQGEPMDLTGNGSNNEAPHTGQAFDYSELDMGDISSSLGSYFNEKMKEDPDNVMAMAQLLGVGGADAPEQGGPSNADKTSGSTI